MGPEPKVPPQQKPQRERNADQQQHRREVEADDHLVRLPKYESGCERCSGTIAQKLAALIFLIDIHLRLEDR